MCGRGDGDEQRWWWLYVKLTRPEICGATRQPRSGERNFEKNNSRELGFGFSETRWRLAGDYPAIISQWIVHPQKLGVSNQNHGFRDHKTCENRLPKPRPKPLQNRSRKPALNSPTARGHSELADAERNKMQGWCSDWQERNKARA